MGEYTMGSRCPVSTTRFKSWHVNNMALLKQKMLLIKSEPENFKKYIYKKEKEKEKERANTYPKA
jgi:hypothetical protein